MTYLIILTESLELYHATKQLLDSSKVVLRQARHLDDLAKSILKHPIHMVILDELASTPNRIRASGYADSQPMVPNVDSLGNPILENQAKNRRFEIRMYMN